MRLSATIALRYIFSKKSTNVINLITAISMIAIGVITGALILVVSVFNGFEGLVKSMYNVFDPELKVTLVEGKTFVPEPDLHASILAIEGVEAISFVLEENAILRYEDNEFIARIKGVDADFLKVSPIDSMMYNGAFALNYEDEPLAVVGAGIEARLGVRLMSEFNALRIYVPKRTDKVIMNPEQAFNRKSLKVAGSFSIQQEFDSKYAFVPLSFARDLLDYENEISAIEIRTVPEVSSFDVQSEVAELMGERFKVRDRYQQNEALYGVMKSEKWVVFALLSFILLIASFNIIGSLSMLAIEKAKDISTLKTLGMTARNIRQIFMLEGLFSSLIGALGGIVMAILICVGQQQFGWVKLQGNGTFVIDAYPVDMEMMDFALVMMIVVGISLLASALPAVRASRQRMVLKEE